MALWGTSDNSTIPGAPGTVAVVGTASSEFWTVDTDAVPAGITILLDGGDEGFVTVESVIAPGLSRVGKMSAVAAGSYAATYCDQPISLKNDPGYAESSADGSLGRTQKPVGVATAGVDAANDAGRGGFHAGWVGIMTYVDMHGNLRQKTETYVAASGIQTGNRPFPV